MLLIEATERRSNLITFLGNILSFDPKKGQFEVVNWNKIYTTDQLK